jgi:hypothetical protein
MSYILLKKISIFGFLLAVIVLTTSQGQCENWKEFFKDSDEIWQYDKDSIHYPQQKKIMGLTVRNKEIVNVSTRNNSGRNEKMGEAWMVRVYCVERECVGCGLFDPWFKKLSGSREPIEPGSLYESLLKKVCP